MALHFCLHLAGGLSLLPPPQTHNWTFNNVINLNLNLALRNSKKEYWVKFYSLYFSWQRSMTFCAFIRSLLKLIDVTIWYIYFSISRTSNSRGLDGNSLKVWVRDVYLFIYVLIQSSCYLYWLKDCTIVIEQRDFTDLSPFSSSELSTRLW